MTDNEKRQLTYLLDKYKNELLYNGTKAQYNHARILVDKLSNEKQMNQKAREE